MSKNTQMLKEAIADAKAVKDSAIANAKAILEENFGTKLKSMLASKLEEMDNEENQDLDLTTENEEVEEEFSLDEILSELEKEEDNELNEEGEEENEELPLDDIEGEDEEIDLENATDEELISFIEEVIADMVESGELEPGDNFDSDSDLDSEEGEEEELDLDLDTEEDVTESYKQELPKSTPAIPHSTTESRELREAMKVIRVLKKEMRDINLLNSKLLYNQRILKEHKVTQPQILQIIRAFDKANTVKETKIVYEILKENLSNQRYGSKPNPRTKSRLKEGLIHGASKPLGVAKSKTRILESDQMVERFQKLAGIKK